MNVGPIKTQLKPFPAFSMANIKSGLFAALPFALLRTPILPWSSDLLDRKLDLLENHQKVSFLKEAIFLASPELYYRWENELKQPAIDNSVKNKIGLALNKYLLRMSFRCTPFGLFAGVTVVHFADTTALRLADASEGSRACRPDLRFLMNLAGKIEKECKHVSHVKYFSNPTVYQLHESHHYVENSNLSGYQLSSVESSNQLRDILAHARSGAYPLELARSIVQDDVELPEALAFVDELIEHQLLISATVPTLTGEDYLRTIRNFARGVSSFNAHLAYLESIIKEINATPVGDALVHYQKLQSWKAQHYPDFASNVSYTDFHRKATSSKLGMAVADEIIRAVDFLAHLPDNPRVVTIDSFRKAFVERYEEREIPLLQAIDPENGIGYPYSLDDIKYEEELFEGLPTREVNNLAPLNEQSEWQEFLFAQYVEALKSAHQVMNLDVAACAPYLQAKAASTSFSLFSYASVIATTQNEIDDGNFELIHHLTSGPSFANPLARFGHLSKELEQLLREAAQEEQEHYPEAVLCDVLYPAKGQAVNLMSRPRLRQYELALLGNSDAGDDRTLHLSDLLVSVQHGRVVLRCRKNGFEVIPRLSSAHVYSSDQFALYTFLGDLQHQGLQRALRWRWGALEQAPFLPRVVLGKTILSKARWKLSAQQVKKLLNPDIRAVKHAVTELMAQLALPRHVALVNGEDEIPLDLMADAGVTLFQSLVKSPGKVLLQENLAHRMKWLTDSTGAFVNELIIPLKNTQFKAPLRSHPRQLAFPIQRIFTPGSEWVYIKIYCSPSMSDKLLLEVIQPAANNMVQSAMCKKWFFVRYKDNDYHLRVRLLCEADKVSEVSETVLGRLGELEQMGMVQSIQMATYSRELERYGAEHMSNSETLFFHQSELAIAIISRLYADETNPSVKSFRWLSAIYFIDQLLTSFECKLPEKVEITNIWQNVFKQEFKANDHSAKKKLSVIFRREKDRLSTVLDGKPNNSFSFYQELIDDSFLLQKHIIANLMIGDPVKINANIMNYTHMFINRLFISQPRRYEFVLYDLLHQYYLSRRARNVSS